MPTNVKIDKGSAFDGAAIVQGGIGNYVYLINKEDVDKAQVLTFESTTKEIEDTLKLQVGGKGFKFESAKGSAQIIPSSPLRAVSSIDGFDHTLELRILDCTQLSVDNAKNMRFQKVVAIVPLANGKFMMYGRRVGLRMSEWELTPGDADTGGTFKVILKTPDNDPPEIDPPHLIESTYVITALDTAAV